MERKRSLPHVPVARSTLFLLVLGICTSTFLFSTKPSSSDAARYHFPRSVSTTFSDGFDDTRSTRGGNASILRPRDDDDHSCTASKECSNGACCGSFQGTDTGVCGYGPTYCGDDCTSNCDAKAECGEYADDDDEYCPLNVCCSQYGFCGTTVEYCDDTCQNNCVEDPAVPDGANTAGVLTKVIGYYEGWANSRSCYKFPPSDVPTEGLTHVNFAFAYIDPDSYEVVTMESDMPSSLFVQVTDIKTQSTNGANIQVFVSIGGWTFSDNDTATQPVFGDIASSAANREKFANNLVSFMKQYGFDGVDIDWEYPGAGDRGGKEEDTENYVQLMKTLRETFDASDGTYGLTFTAPSSYWYLRWFDLPGMVEYADWINLMAYDLHGTWDSNDPIGNIVQAHTNLTEIKQSASLFWRVDIPPEKVVLGLGFYGRSFMLEDSSCSSPGCAFSGGGDAGECTDSSGTLAYFEIMDIMDKQDPDVVWDKTDAVKYFQFGSKNDQWISYDDSDTFGQKVDWANDVGLGGVMIWSVDQDTTDFDALGGLLGKQLTAISKLEANTKADSGSWASQNGQNCQKTDCMKSSEKGSWGSDWGIAPNGDAFKDNCDSGKNRYIICPVDQMPSTCQWRGGESGRGCHGQCHTGEVTLFHSKHATVSCLSPGQQSFCCESNTWSELVDSCTWSSDDTCSSGKTWVAMRKSWTEVFGLSDSWYEATNEALCCDSGFDECHWIGQGYCDDNECADYEIELDTDDYGNTSSTCARITGRKKVLCCTASNDLQTFLPVEIDYLFPTTPPTTDIVDYDISYIQDEPAIDTDGTSETIKGAFGWVVIDGPSDTVTSLTSRDESHIQFLDCDAALEKRETGKIYTVRYICMNDSDQSNCDAVHENGAEGTIVKLPEDCGFAHYGVVHDIRSSENSTVSSELLKRAPPNPAVHEMDISYDFSRVKRDSGDVYFRIDYGDIHSYWENVVAGEPVTKRDDDLSANKTETTRSQYYKRFWSKDASNWMTLFDNIRGDTLATGYTLDLIEDEFYSYLIDKDATLDCSASSSSTSLNDAGFLQAYFLGSVRSSIRWGVTLVGTISPSLNVEEAYGFFDTDVDLAGRLLVNGYADLDIAGSTNPVDMFSSDISNYGWSHPGIGSMQPKMNVGVQMMGKGTINADFEVYINSGSDGKIRTDAPISLGDLSGTVLNQQSGQAWEGGTVDGTLPDGVDSGTLLGFKFNVKTWLELEVDVLGETVEAAKGTFYTEVPHHVIVTSDGDTVKVESGDEQIRVEVYSSGISSSWEQDDDSGNEGVGSSGTQFVIRTASAGEGEDEHSYVGWGENTVLSDIELSCPNNSSGTIVCYDTGNMSTWDDDWSVEEPGEEVDDDSSDAKRRSIRLGKLANFWGFDRRELEKRGTGNKRKFVVKGPNGDFTITSHRYPNGDNGDYLKSKNDDAGNYVLADPQDCRNYGASSSGSTSTESYVTEHIVELDTHSMALEFMMTGSFEQIDGSYYTVANSLRVDQAYFTTYYQQVWNQWDPQNRQSTSTPIDDIWTAFGDTTNPDVLVNMESTWNGIKMQMWQGHRVMAPTTWRRNGFADATGTTGYTPATRAASSTVATSDDPFERAEMALSSINAAAAVFSYMNSNTVNQNYADVLNSMYNTFEAFDESVLAVTGATINTALLFSHFVYNCLNQQVENVEAWIDDRLNTLENTWQSALNGASANDRARIQIILDTINGMREDLVSSDFLLLDIGSLTFEPPSAD